MSQTNSKGQVLKALIVTTVAAYFAFGVIANAGLAVQTTLPSGIGAFFGR